MTSRGTSQVDLIRLVRSLVIDISLLKWFATNDERGADVAEAIKLARHRNNPNETSVLDFLERHILGDTHRS